MIKVNYMNYIVPICAGVSLINQILLFIINPGIIYSDGDTSNNYENKIYCHYCKFFYPKSNKKMEHCFICNICVCNLDHHCGVVGKCVGRYNTFIFSSFVLTISGFIFSLYMLLFNFMFHKKK